MKAPTFEEFQAMAQAVNVRPRFAHTYSIKSEDRKKANEKPRLLDFLVFIAPESNADFLAISNDGEIAVIDMVRREKAFFAVPETIQPAQISAMVRDFFGTPGVRVTHCMWVA